MRGSHFVPSVPLSNQGDFTGEAPRGHPRSPNHLPPWHLPRGLWKVLTSDASFPPLSGVSCEAGLHGIPRGRRRPARPARGPPPQASGGCWWRRRRRGAGSAAAISRLPWRAGASGPAPGTRTGRSQPVGNCDSASWPHLLEGRQPPWDLRSTDLRGKPSIRFIFWGTKRCQSCCQNHDVSVGPEKH